MDISNGQLGVLKAQMDTRQWAKCENLHMIECAEALVMGHRIGQRDTKSILEEGDILMSQQQYWST